LTLNQITDEAIVGFVVHYTERNGLGPVTGVGLDTPLITLGLDSITMTGMLLTALDELKTAGLVVPGARLPEVPPLDDVGDLAAVLRSMGAANV
jgi:hypothetical protein